MIKQDPKNTRLHPEENKAQIKKSLEDLGAGRSIVIDNEDYVIAGNGVHEQAQKLGLKTRIIESDGTELIVVKRTDLSYSDQKRRDLAVADNATAESSEWDYEELSTEEMEGWEIAEIEQEEEEEGKEQKQVEQDEFEAALSNKTLTQMGDLYQIGVHRLLCGDSLDEGQVSRLMKDKKASLAHNDPPYGMKKENEGVLNDNLNYSDLLDFNKKWIPLQLSFLEDNGSFYCWGIDEPLMDIYSGILKPLAKENKITFRNLLTWDKGHGQSQNSELTRSFATADEKCLFIMKGVQGFNNNADHYFEGWEPIRTYLLKQREICGWDIPTMKEVAGHSDKNRDHWTSKSQWNLLTEKVYLAFQNWAKQNNKEAFKKSYAQIKKQYLEIKKEHDKIKLEFYNSRGYFNNTHDNMNNVWHFKRHVRDGQEGGHATPKPIPLCGRVIKSSSRENEIVLDFFLGSGSTMVAAHQLDRKCYGLELDPKYCDVIIKRMISLDPTITVTRNGKDCKQDFRTDK